MKYLLCTVLFVSTVAFSSASVLCDLKWPRCGLTVENTVCEKDEKCLPEPGCQDVPADPEFLKFILHEHNRLRNQVASGAETRGYTGVAANMMALSYDKDLEYTARCHINSCKFEHDKCRGTSKFLLAGQNLYYTSESQEALKEAVNTWYEEIQQMTPDVIDNFPKGREDVEKFTQMIWATTTHIGCARAKSDDGKYYLACNYGPKGNHHSKTVFDRGTPATKCGLFGKPNPFYPALCGVIDQSMLGVGRGGSGGNQTDDVTNSTNVAPIISGIKDLSNIGVPPVLAGETKTTEKDDSGGAIGGVGFGGFGFGGLPPGVPGAPGAPQGPQNNNNNEKKKTKKPDKTTVTASTTNTTAMNSTTPLNTTVTTPLTTNTTPVTTTRLTTVKPIALPTVELPKPKKPTRRLSRGSVGPGISTKWYVLFCFVFLMIGFWFFMCRRSAQ